MAEYYLISQLPSLDGISESTPMPVTEEQFFELCGRFLGKKAQSEMEKLTLLPSKEFEKSNSPLVRAWNQGERNLRIALGKIRAEKMKKNFDMDSGFLPTELVKTAAAATEIQRILSQAGFPRPCLSRTGRAVRSGRHCRHVGNGSLAPLPSAGKHRTAPGRL